MRLANISSFSLAAAILVSSLNFGYGATTDPVGAVNIVVPAGTTILSAPFQKGIVYQGNVDSVAGVDVTLPSAVPALTGPHYVQVLSGTDLGRVYNISATLGSTVTLDRLPFALTNGDTVAIRPHTTISDLGAFPDFSTVTLLNPGASPDVYTYFFGWSVPDAIIYPGEGFVVNSSTPFNLSLVGAVSVNDVILEANSGSSVIGNLDPVNGSVGTLSGLLADLPDFATLLELDPGGNPIVYTKFFGWSPDPSAIDLTNYKTIVVNAGATDLDVVMPANVIGP